MRHFCKSYATLTLKALLGFLILFMLGCGSSSNTFESISGQQSAPAGTAFEVTAAGVVNNSAILEIGDILQFTTSQPALQAKNALYQSTSPTTVGWVSSNPQVGSINSAGLFTALSGGTTDVSAILNGRQSTNAIRITVIGEGATLQSIVITATPATGSVAVGTSVSFSALGQFSDDSTANLTGQVTWASTLPSVGLAPSTNGAFVALAAGTTQISATLDGVVSNTLTINVTTSQSSSLELVSFDPAGVPSIGARPAVSADGRFVAYEGINAFGETAVNTYVRDRQTGERQLVSISNEGVPVSAALFADGPDISDDGNFVVFTTNFSQLVPNDTNGQPDVFLYDRSQETIERISVTESGEQGNGISRGCKISGNGRYVAYITTADNLQGGPLFRVVVYDRQTGQTELIPLPSGYSAAADCDISTDGQVVAFRVGGGNENIALPIQVHVYDRQSQELELIVSGGERPVLSGNGRFVGFISTISDLVPGAFEPGGDRSPVYSYVRDRTTGDLNRVTVNAQGVGVIGSVTSLSQDGRFASFQSSATGIVPEDNGGTLDIFVRDLQQNQNVRISQNPDGTDPSSDSRASALSADGRFVVFESRATSLIESTIELPGIAGIFIGRNPLAPQ